MERQRQRNTPSVYFHELYANFSRNTSFQNTLVPTGMTPTARSWLLFHHGFVLTVPKEVLFAEVVYRRP